MKFYSDIPDLHIIRQRLVGNRTEGYELCKFDKNGELETNETEVIRQLKNIYRHDDEVKEAKPKVVKSKTVKTKTAKSSDGLKHCKKCDFTCDNQGKLLKHYKLVHPKT